MDLATGDISLVQDPHMFKILDFSHIQGSVTHPDPKEGMGISDCLKVSSKISLDTPIGFDSYIRIEILLQTPKGSVINRPKGDLI